jgi:hydrogenase 3 maturation protease
MQSRQLADALKKALQASRPPGPEAGSGPGAGGAPAGGHLLPLVVLGVGSELRGDDAAGVLVAARLGETAQEAAPRPGLHAIPGGTAPENHTGEIKALRPAGIIIVDAADMGEPPGTVRVIPLDRVGGVSFSTHTLPLNVVAEYLRMETGAAVVILGIQPLAMDFDGPVSAETEAGVALAVEGLRELAALRAGGTQG